MKLNIDLKNCYGISELTHCFDFTSSSGYAIYAPNGFMKTSLSKTFDDYAKGRDSADLIFTDRTTTRILMDGILLNLCRRVLALPLETGSGSRIIRNGVETYDPVGSAINHPIGHATQALINLWFKQNPNDNDLLPADLKPIFTALCDVQVDHCL